MSNAYIYCPICSEKLESWSGFWPDKVFRVRRSSVRCQQCEFAGELVVKVGDDKTPKVNIKGLRE